MKPERQKKRRENIAIDQLTTTLVIPCLNDEAGIAEVLSRRPEGIDETLVVVDRRTTDQSAEAAEKMGARVLWEPLPGYGRAYRSGFANVQTDLIVTLDADGTYPVEDIPSLVRRLRDQKLDFLNGSRFPLEDPQSMMRLNQIGNRVITGFVRILYMSAIRDALSGMWIFRRSFLDRARFLSYGWNFSADIKIEAITRSDIRFGEHPIHYRPRVGDTKLMPWRVGMINLAFLFAKRVHTWSRFLSR